MDESQIKHVIEAALLAAGKPLSTDQLLQLFSRHAEVDKPTVKAALEALASDYQDRGIELKEVASGFRVQIRRSMSDWLTPLWEERAPRYTRALLETLALIAYRQPITRAEIEEVRGVVVSTNIVRTLLERGWVRIVGHRDVPGRPAMFGTTKEFLDYFGLKRLDDLPPLAEIKDLASLNVELDLPEVFTRPEQGELVASAENAEEAAEQTSAESAEPTNAEPAEPTNAESAAGERINAESTEQTVPEPAEQIDEEPIGSEGEGKVVEPIALQQTAEPN